MRRYIAILFLSLGFLQAQAQRRAYEYDDLNQLKKVTVYSGNVISHTITYTYDQVGNRLSKVVVINCTTPTASISGTQTINEGQSATLSVALTGDTPWNFTVNGQNFSNVTTSPKTFAVSPTTTTTYTISQIANNCGVGTASGSATVTVIPACQLPDLIVQDVVVTKYASDKIYYTVKVKNIGTQTVNLGSFSFSTYGSADATKDNADVLKHVMFLGGGNLAAGATINYNVSASMNYNSNQHYFLVLADHYGLITECNENNNWGSKVVKPCSHSGNQTLTGNYSGLVATNGNLILDDVTASANTLFLAKSITVTPTSPIANRPVMMQIGNCLTVAAASNVLANDTLKTAKEMLLFLEMENKAEISYELTSATKLSSSIWDMEAKSKVKDFYT